MKIIDFIKLTDKLSFRNNIIAIVGLSISLFLILLGLNTLRGVYLQKQQPWEITATGDQSKIAEKTVNDIKSMDNVIMASPVIQVDTTVQMGDYKSQLVLQGIASEYVGPLSEGQMFFDKDILPVIVMNKNALSSFVNDKNKKIKSDEKYLNLKTTLVGEKPSLAKVGGILQDNSDKNIAYISLNSAKNYLLRQRRVPEYTGVSLRLKNVGSAKGVIKTLESMGLKSEEALPTQQQTWETRQNEAMYIALAGLLILVFIILYMLVRVQCDLNKNHGQYLSLLFIGVSKEVIAVAFSIKSMVAFIMSTLLCYGMGYLIPMFMNKEFAAATVFAYQSTWLSFLVLVAIDLICMGTVYVRVRKDK